MNSQPAIVAITLFLYAHYLLSRPDLDPRVRRILEQIEVKALTKFFVVLLAA